MKKVLSYIYGGICRIVFEWGLPICAIFCFNWHIALALWVAFIGWQLLSIFYLGPIVKRQMQDAVDVAADSAVLDTIEEFRVELMGRMTVDERNDAINKIREWHLNNVTKRKEQANA